MPRLRPTLLVALALFVALANAGMAQETKSKTTAKSKKPAAEKPETTKASKEKAKEAKPSKEFQGRLPAYYGEIVTPEQREEIYAIQAKHEAKISKLEAELEAARAELNDEIEDVLSTQQKSRLRALKSAAEEKRKAGADEPVVKPTKKTSAAN